MRVDTTAVGADGDVVRAQTTDTLAKGMPDRREMRNAGRIVKKMLKDGDGAGLFLIPKKNKGE